jgi:predicted GNAT family N-acyltransferase
MAEQQPTPEEARRRMLEAAMASGKATPEEKIELGNQYRKQDRLNQQGYKAATDKKAKGGVIKSSASRRADGIAQRGKTKGRMV